MVQKGDFNSTVLLGDKKMMEMEDSHGRRKRSERTTKGKILKHFYYPSHLATSSFSNIYTFKPLLLQNSITKMIIQSHISKKSTIKMVFLFRKLI